MKTYKCIIANKYEFLISESIFSVKGTEGEEGCFYTPTKRRDHLLGCGAACFEWMIGKLQVKNIKTITECCGGVGRWTSLIKNILNPLKHNIIELARPYYQHLIENFRDSNTQIILGSCYDSDLVFNNDLLIVDHPSFMSGKYFKSDFEIKLFIDKILIDKTNRFVMLTDASISSKFFLHTKNYEKMLGARKNSIQTKEDYIFQFCFYMYKKFKIVPYVISRYSPVAYYVFMHIDDSLIGEEQFKQYWEKMGLSSFNYFKIEQSNNYFKIEEIKLGDNK